MHAWVLHPTPHAAPAVSPPRACLPLHSTLSLGLQLRKDTYNRLTPIQRLQVARHPNRPTFLDIALNISNKASAGGAGGGAAVLVLQQRGRRAGMLCLLLQADGRPQPTGGAERARSRRHRLPPPPLSRQFVELHGDRAGLDDPAMVCGLASIDGVSFMFIGHQKGRNTKVGAGHRKRCRVARRGCGKHVGCNAGSTHVSHNSRL